MRLSAAECVYGFASGVFAPRPTTGRLPLHPTGDFRFPYPLFPLASKPALRGEKGEVFPGPATFARGGAPSLKKY